MHLEIQVNLSGLWAGYKIPGEPNDLNDDELINIPHIYLSKVISPEEH